MTEDTHLIRVQRILQKLQQARELDLKSFGSDLHKFRLNPTLTAAQIAAFEAQHGIQLPPDYRAFLEYAGNGGPGPYYGIFPLNKWNDFTEWLSEDELPENYLSLSCPLHPEMRDMADWREWRENFAGISAYQGTITLGTQGCAYGMQLIVSGEYAGRVVYTDADSYSAPYVVHEPDFLAWYERWLDEMLAGISPNWFGYGPGGGEAELLSILDDPSASAITKSEAVSNLTRLPQLSDEAVRRIPSWLNSSIDEVRRGALAVITKFDLKAYLGDAAQLIVDPSPKVRERTIDTLMRLAPSDYTDLILNRFWIEEDEDTALTAYITLKKVGVLLKAELIRLVEHSNIERLRSWASGDIDWDSSDIPLLLRMLTDLNAQVRRDAISGLAELKAHEKVPQLLNQLAQETDVHVITELLMILGEFGDPSTVPALLEWTNAKDDFHRVEAAEALIDIGDERALPRLHEMLKDHSTPERFSGVSGMRSGHTTSQLIRKKLNESSKPTFRSLT